MKIARSIPFALLSLFASMAACSPSPDASPPSHQQLFDTYLSHCTPPGDFSLVGRFSQMEKLPGIVWNSEELSLCEADLKAGKCQSVHCGFITSQWGTLAAGAACNEGRQCASGECTNGESCGVCAAEACNTPCSGGTKCLKGRCVAPPKAAQLGEPCESVECAEGLQCRAGACTARPKLGEECGTLEDFACGDGAVCREDAKGVARCTLVAKAGESCAEYWHCSPTLVCGSEGKCRAAVTGSLGQPCALGDICTGGLCAPKGPGQTSGVCQAASEAGAPCSSSDGLPQNACAKGLLCEDRTCVDPAATICK